MKTSSFFIFIFLFISTPSSRALTEAQEKVSFQNALTFYSQKKYDQCIIAFNQLAKSNPEKALYLFNLGNCYLMNENFDSAIKIYRKVITLNKGFVEPAKLYLAKTYIKISKHKEASENLEPLTQSSLEGVSSSAQNELALLDKQQELEAQALELYKNNNSLDAENILDSPVTETLSTDGLILLSLCQIKNNKTSHARSTLEKASKLPLVSAENKNDIQQLLKKVSYDNSDLRSWWGFLEYSFGGSSNIYLDGKSTTPLSSSANRLSAGLGYQKSFTPHLLYRLSYQYTQENYSSAAELNTTNNYLQSGIQYESNQFDLSVNPYLQNESWAGQEVSQRLGITLKSNYITDTYDVGASLDYYYQKASASSYSYLAGASSKRKVYAGIWSSKTYYQINYEYYSDGTQDLTYSDGSRLPLTHTGSGPGVKIVHRFNKIIALYFSASYLNKNYKNLALPDNKYRTDSEINTSFKINYNIFPSLQAYFYMDYLSNSSNLGTNSVKDKNYDSTTYYLGINWDFL